MLDLLKQYGPELVGAAVDNVADYVGDVEEIGSSDVSAWVAQVVKMLKDNPPEAFDEGYNSWGGSGPGGLLTPYAVYIKDKGGVRKLKNTNKAGQPMNTRDAEAYVAAMRKKDPARWTHDTVWVAPDDLDLDEASMSSAEHHDTGPEFTGYWKGTDSATPGNKMVGGAAESKEFKVPAARNFVAKNMKTSGAGQHKDAKRAAKQGDVKHKAQAIPTDEGAKVDRMQQHIAKSEKDLGHSKKDAEAIAWATLNKRGYLDNANKKKHTNESVNLTESVTYKLWESAGRKIVEAQLTADQIQQLFQQAEQSATAAGGNRTMVGQGKDVATAVNKAWEDLKTKVQNSGPVQGIDAKYDQAAEKLKQATGGDQGVMKYVEKYRTFAKAHPIAQGIIYSALIAAAGISGAGLGGAAALGLFKMVDKLLQGEKFSSAAYSGAKTGALAYGAGQLGQAMKGGDQATAAATGGPTVLNPRSVIQQIQSGQITNQQQLLDLMNTAGGPTKNRALWAILRNQAGMPSSGDASAIIQAIANKAPVSESRYIDRNLTVYTWMLNESAGLPKGGVQLTTEGIGDMFKKAAGAVGNWAQTKGHNLTTKVTADKLQSAWKKAGSPTDSDEVAQILQQAGVGPDVVKQIYTGMKIPAPATTAPTQSAPALGQTAQPAPATTAPTQSAPAPGQTAQPAPANTQAAGAIKPNPARAQTAPATAAPTQPTAPGAQPAPAAKPHTGGRVAGAGLSQTPNAIRQRQQRAAQKQPGVAPTAQPQQPATGGAGAFGQMAQQATAQPGGTTQQTSRGLIHRANPNNPNAQYAEGVNFMEWAVGQGNRFANFAGNPEVYAQAKEAYLAEGFGTALANVSSKISGHPRKMKSAQQIRNRAMKFKPQPIAEEDVEEDYVSEIKKGQKDSNGYTSCWTGYHAQGTKKSATTGKQVRNCVPNESLEETEAWQKANKKDKTDGMSRKAVKAYRREHPGSKLKTAVTTKPSKLKKGSKASKRRKSYCSRSKGQMKMHSISCAKTPDKAICKARRRWNCEGVERLDAMLAEAIEKGTLQPGQYYIWTVYFDDGTSKKIKVTKDNFDPKAYYAKKNQVVINVDYSWEPHNG
jgi:hypothetical protein